MAFGRYLDDPKVVEHDRLRSHGGCLVQGGALNPSISLPEGLKSESLLTKEYVLATFNGSPSIAPFVVYPKVTKWFDKYGYKMSGPVIETYKTLPDETVLTTYLFSYQ